MALPVSPIKKITKLDRISPHNLYRAVDFQGERPRYLHLSGLSITEDKNYSWMGTKKQFNAICALHEWDGFSLVSVSKFQ